jgi:hypothetical protein
MPIYFFLFFLSISKRIDRIEKFGHSDNTYKYFIKTLLIKTLLINTLLIKTLLIKTLLIKTLFMKTLLIKTYKDFT